MVEIPLVRFRLTKLEPWLLSEFSVFMTPGGKLTSIVFNKEKNGTPSESTIRKLLEPIAFQKHKLPTLVPFFIDVVSSVSESKNLLLVYKKIGSFSGRNEFKLVSVYTYRKDNFVSAIIPLDDLSFELSFYHGQKQVYSVKLSSFHFESNELKKATNITASKPVEEKDKVMVSKFVKTFRAPVDKTKAKKSAPQPQKRNQIVNNPEPIEIKKEEVISSAAVSDNLSHYPQLLGIISQAASLDMEALVLLKERINSILVLKEASLMLKTIREKNLDKDNMLTKQALLLGELMQKEKPEINEIEKFVSILKSLMK